jgi:hypothetical protein
MCVSPDYVLCPKDLVDQFIDVVIKTWVPWAAR